MFGLYFTESRYVREAKSSNRDDLLLVQSIQITDKFGFDKQTADKARSSSSSETVFVAADPASFCVNGLGKDFYFIYDFLLLKVTSLPSVLNQKLFFFFQALLLPAQYFY